MWDYYVRMSDKEAKAESIGAQLARLRWAKASDADRAAAAAKMTAGRRKARLHRQAKIRGNK
ncbi:MAG: hypothetical protein RJA59_1481 [Pseudomonadota bacterium]|jgi:hypothetical protein